jgi:hypothetical protein
LTASGWELMLGQAPLRLDPNRHQDWLTGFH